MVVVHPKAKIRSCTMPTPCTPYIANGFMCINMCTFKVLS